MQGGVFRSGLYLTVTVLVSTGTSFLRERRCLEAHKMKVSKYKSSPWCLDVLAMILKESFPVLDVH